MKHEIKPVATFGDLVMVHGYGTDLFAVDAYDITYHYEPGEAYTEIIYDLTGVYGNSGYIISEQEDVTLACKAEKSDAFLQAYEPAPTAEDTSSALRSIYFAIGNGGEIEMQTKPTKVAKVKVPTKQERIDALLDEMINVKTAMQGIGDANGSYQRRIDAIEAQLKELAE